MEIEGSRLRHERFLAGVQLLALGLPERVAARVDLDDGGSEIGQELRAERTGDRDAEIDFGGSNYVASFEAMKTRWHGFIDGAVDHAFQLNADDPQTLKIVTPDRSHRRHRIAIIAMMRRLGVASTNA